jgi:hypothetical protein
MADVQYYNLTISNSDLQTAGQTYGEASRKIPASIFAYNDNPIIADPSEYYCSIARFEVPCDYVPVIQFIVQTDSAGIVQDPNLGVNSFTLTYGNTVSTQEFVNFITQIENQPTPPVGTLGQQFTSYYFIFSYSWWLKLLNTALNAAITNLKTQVGAPIAAATAPFFSYDPKTQLITLYADKLWYDNSLATPIDIYFNSVSIPAFNGFVFNRVSSGSANGADCYFVIRNDYDLNIQTLGTVDYILSSQEYVGLSYLSTLSSFIISTSMNIKSESSFILNPTNGNAQNLQYSNILTDFIPDLSSTNEAGLSSKIFIFTAPVNMYRPFQFNQKDPLYNVSVNISFTDSFGNVYPLQLPKYNNVSIKFQFMKKSIFASMSGGQKLIKSGF